MSKNVLGESFDLHLGGEDLIFPHHEDEIAQSEGATGKPFVKYWLHGAHLLVEGKKMSKSLGNFFTLRDLLAKGFTGREIRYLLLTAHYRETFNFTIEGLQGARAALARIDECVGKLREIAGDVKADEDNSFLQQFEDSLDDDLNVSGTWGKVFEWIRQVNRKIVADEHSVPYPGRSTWAARQLATWNRMDSIFGVGLKSETTVPPEILALLEARQAARKAKDFKKSDAIRDELKGRGWTIEDTPKGARAKRL